MLKKYKPNDGGDDDDVEMPPPAPRSNGKQRATVEDYDEDEDERQHPYDFARKSGVQAEWALEELPRLTRALPGARRGPHAAGGDADYFVDEDDEGRMFGGGLNEDQKMILDMCVARPCVSASWKFTR